MRFIIWILGLLFVSNAFGQSSTSYDVEFSRICLIDSIAPDTLVQFWRFTYANNPGEFTKDVTFDLSGAYVVEGTLLRCCSCYTETSAFVPTVEENARWAGVRLKYGIWGIVSAVFLLFFIIPKIEKKKCA